MVSMAFACDDCDLFERCDADDRAEPCELADVVDNSLYQCTKGHRMASSHDTRSSHE